MNKTTALAIVYDLACQNALDEEFEDDPVLGEKYRDQQKALVMVEAMSEHLAKFGIITSAEEPN